MPWRRTWQSTWVFLPEESPWTEEPGRLQSMGSQRVGHRHDWVTKHIITSRVILVLSSHSFFLMSHDFQIQVNMNSIFLGSREHIEKRKGKSLHSRSFYLCRSPCVLKKLSEQDECLMAHSGGTKCCGWEKALVTEDTVQMPRTELKSRLAGKNQEMFYRGNLVNL